MSLSIPASIQTDPVPTSVGADTDPHRWRLLVLLSCAELLGMSLWFAASAVSAQLGAQWKLSPSSLVWLTAIVLLGFVICTAVLALLNLSDIIPARCCFDLALLGAAATRPFSPYQAIAQGSGESSADGFPLAGVYPPAMKE
jgi:hypothetical protein